MADDNHIAQLMKEVAAWNAWREENPDIRPDLSGANLTDLSGADPKAKLSNPNFGKAILAEANLSKADLRNANLTGAVLYKAILRGADLREAYLTGADLTSADLNEANLSGAYLDYADFFLAFVNDADLSKADLSKARLQGAQLQRADLREANLREACLGSTKLEKANLSGANLMEAYLAGADLAYANLSGANLYGADLANAFAFGANLTGANFERAILVDTCFTRADLTGCRIYGISAWDLTLDKAKQQNLVITRPGQPKITVDNIEVAQFIYLMLNNQNIRDVIDTITSKAVLILGRFTDERKAVLDALREELRKRNYLPILFDLAVPATRDITETVSLLARMARFIIADLTDPSSIPKELEAIVPSLAVPVQPLLEGSSRPYAMFKDYWKYEWVLPVYRYEGLEPLLATLAEKVIAPAEAKVNALVERRRMIEAELTKPQ